MNLPDHFFSLLIRCDGLSESERIHISDVYKQYGRDQIYEIVSKKKILPFVGKTFSAQGIDADFWLGILNEYRSRNRKILEFLDKTYAALEAHGVRKMFVSENFGALLSADADIGLFASGDVDNYAPVEEKEKIYTAMSEIGCEIHERFAVKHQIAAEFFPGPEYGLPEKFYMNVDFYPLARLKLPCLINADDFVEWDETKYYKDTHVRLASADALAYICMLHISLHSFSRAPDIRLYIDLLNMSQTNVNYQRILEWCKKDKTCTRAAVAGYISNELMGTRFPTFIIESGYKIKRILKLVYNSNKKELIYEPRRAKLLLIESLCDDGGILHGISKIICPASSWLYSIYGANGIAAHIKHIFRVI